MFIRGSGSGQEFRRVDNSFYRGIVVKNNDPLGLDRVKVYIAELTNQPYDEWFEKYDSINVKAPGSNNTDSWKDTAMFEEIAKLIPWAEQCFPLMGEGSNYRYWKDGKICTISDCNYPEGFRVNDKDVPTLQTGSFSPAFLYENESTVLGDAFNHPLDNFTVKCNPYSFSYRPSKHVNKGKGLFGIPNVGTKVWVFHHEGDLNFPIVMGVIQDYRTLSLINESDNENKLSVEIPSNFEN